MPAIPKIIHQIWLGSASMHPLMASWHQKWLDLNQGWTVTLWSDVPGTNDPCQIHCSQFGLMKLAPPLSPLMVKACHLSQRSNIWRYRLVQQFGGVYIDTDVEPFKPIDSLVANHTTFAAHRKANYTRFECAFFGAVPNHPWADDLVRGLVGRDPAVTLSMGTEYFTLTTFRHPEVVKLAKEHIWSEPPENWSEAKREAKVPDANENVIPEAYAKHHWSSAWYPEGFKPCLSG